MLYNPVNYVLPDEMVFLTGNYYDDSQGTKTQAFIITNKKLVCAGENSLLIIPLKQIVAIRSVGIYLSIMTSAGTESVTMYHVNNPMWTDTIAQTIAKLL